MSSPIIKPYLLVDKKTGKVENRIAYDGVAPFDVGPDHELLLEEDHPELIPPPRKIDEANLPRKSRRVS